jgi:hypothetical protein
LVAPNPESRRLTDVLARSAAGFRDTFLASHADGSGESLSTSRNRDPQGDTVKRYGLVAAVALAHMLAAAVLIARMAAVAMASRSPEVAADAERTIWIQTAVLMIPALLLLIGVAGLWLRRRWGWGAAAAADVSLLALVAGDWLLGGQHVQHGPVLALLAALLAPLLVPAVRARLTSPSNQVVGAVDRAWHR